METPTTYKPIIKSCPIWNEMITELLQQPDMIAMQKQIMEMRKTTTIYPSSKDVLNAYKLTPYDKVLVVIIGQDPYHDGTAHGLAFSSTSSKRPPSLREIFNEVCTDYYSGTAPDDIFTTNNLTHWAEQGVLLLNRSLTVEAKKPNSHAKIGWNKFLIRTIEKLNEKQKPIVYMLWGAEAQKLKTIINPNNLILEAEHPVAYIKAQRPSHFRGCQHFSQANNFIIKHHKPFKAPIGWAILP